MVKLSYIPMFFEVLLIGVQLYMCMLVMSVCVCVCTCACLYACVGLYVQPCAICVHMCVCLCASGCLLTVWRPGEDWDTTQEGKRYRIYSLTAAPARQGLSPLHCQLRTFDASCFKIVSHVDILYQMLPISIAAIDEKKSRFR